MTTASSSYKRHRETNWKIALVWVCEAYLMPAAAAALMLATCVAVWIARDWPLVHDAPLIHYVVFLMDHGRAPYRDIVEMNMPGTYMLEWAAMHTLGGGAAGWRIFDLLSGAIAIASSAWVAGRTKRLTGIAGGAFAYLVHLSYGPINLGQRDWIISVMLLAAFGCMFKAIRERRPAWMAGFMLLCGSGAAIKPPLLAIGIAFLAAACWLVSRGETSVDSVGDRWTGGSGAMPARGREGSPHFGKAAGMGIWLGFVRWSILGACLPFAIVLIFLLRWGVVHDLVDSMHGLIPLYAALMRLSPRQLIEAFRGIVTPLKPLVLGAGVVFLLNRSWRRWESCLLAMAAAAGIVLFVLQGKGFAYHLYTAMVFASVWAMLELDIALRAGLWPKLIATSALLFTLLVMVPKMLKTERDRPYFLETMTHLEEDLNRLGGPALSGKVQCLDMTMGSCINVLYRMQLVQTTGFIYDYYLFPKQANATTQTLQTRFLNEMNAAAPEVIVFSSHTWPGDTYSYEQMKNWPAFADFLRQRYRVDKELPQQALTAGYRIYVLNKKSLLRKEPQRVPASGFEPALRSSGR